MCALTPVTQNGQSCRVRRRDAPLMAGIAFAVLRTRRASDGASGESSAADGTPATAPTCGGPAGVVRLGAGPPPPLPLAVPASAVGAGSRPRKRRSDSATSPWPDRRAAPSRQGHLQLRPDLAQRLAAHHDSRLPSSPHSSTTSRTAASGRPPPASTSAVAFAIRASRSGPAPAAIRTSPRSPTPRPYCTRPTDWRHGGTPRGRRTRRRGRPPRRDSGRRRNSAAPSESGERDVIPPSYRSRRSPTPGFRRLTPR